MVLGVGPKAYFATGSILCAELIQHVPSPGQHQELVGLEGVGQLLARLIGDAPLNCGVGVENLSLPSQCSRELDLGRLRASGRAVTMGALGFSSITEKDSEYSPIQVDTELKFSGSVPGHGKIGL